jgi:hypothetical protein
MQVSSATMSYPSLRTAALPYLPLGIKDLLKEDRGFLLWGFCFGGFCFEAFAFGFDFWAFGF